MEEFGISHTIAILPISLFLMGLGTGPLLVGPLSEVHGMLYYLHSSIFSRLIFLGRNPVYLGSFIGFFIFSWPVAFAPNIGACYPSPGSVSSTHPFPIFPAVLIFFRFVTGLCGAAFLSVTGGSISDLFLSSEIAT